MNEVRKWLHRGRAARAGALVTAVAAAVAGLAVAAGPAQAATQGPCDIYASGGTPCVAAHSTTRALYGNYNGSLYQVKRSSDNSTLNIGVTSAGGYANAAAQDSFCAGTSCVITEIYDQSGNGNNLTVSAGGAEVSTPDNPASATAAPITVNGHEAYGVYISQGIGYRDDSTKGVATGDNPESEYDVVDGTHYDNGCCFDYGNAETDNSNDGNGTMEAIYFGNASYWDTGAGSGPWIMADLENGLFDGSNVNSQNTGDPVTNYRFTTAMLEGGSNQWALLGGNAQSGGLSTDYSGPRPSGYNPMKKEGAILLGTGGDNSNFGAGTFYEGVMTTGYASASTEAAVQANIVAAGYAGTAAATTGPLHAVGAGKCLDDPGASTTAGTQQEIWDCNGAANQTWTRTSSNQLTLSVGGSTFCLDANGAGTTAGTKVIIWPCSGGANQQWTFNGSGAIVGVQSGLCLDVTGGNTADGTLAELWNCTGGTNQQWTLG
ncbi:MAG TPA: arabinofuranosidase catalytic domain-containing protein [Actinospica sp.]|nr:arabinofuranosidase catalytic domain-containing protein [Actinospica sp.]